MDTFSNVTLKLSILEPDPPPDRGRLTQMPPDAGLLSLRNGEFAGRSFRTVLQVCATPTCPCCKIRVQCQSSPPTDANDGDSWRGFWLDVWDKKLVQTPELKEERKAAALANAISAELTGTDWEQLFRWFRIAKLEAIHTTELEKVDITHLPESKGGRMIPFVEVFPWGNALEFEIDGALWTVEEQFCVQPGCTCKETILSFVQYENSRGRRMIPRKSPPAVRYNYETRALTQPSPWPDQVPSRQAMIDAVRRANPSINSQLELRHTILQTLYMQQVLSGVKAQLNALSPAAPRTPKVGRNDPCPCGSGKKFKHCCLRAKG